MCEVKEECSAKGTYWVQRAETNVIACGRHLAKAVLIVNGDLGSDDPPDAILPLTTVKVRQVRGAGWVVWI